MTKPTSIAWPRVEYERTEDWTTQKQCPIFPQLLLSSRQNIAAEARTNYSKAAGCGLGPTTSLYG